MISTQESQPKQLIKDRVQKAIIAYTKCDLKQTQILTLNYLKKVDLVISSLCIEAVAETLDEYDQMVNNISKMIKSKGHLVLFGVLE
jgi:hypothetical protein